MGDWQFSNLIGLIGIVVLIGIAWMISENRRRVPIRIIVGGIGLQFVLAFLLLWFQPVVDAFEVVAGWVNKVISSADAGIDFVFGPALGDPGGPAGFVFAFRALPVIIFFASLMAVLYHFGLMQRLIAALAWVLRRTLGVTGTEAMAMAANVFVGQTEAPLCVKPFLERMTRSQLMLIMTGGFATVAGSVLAFYVGILGTDEESQRAFIKALLTASVMSAPAAFVMAKIIVPETGTPVDGGLHDASGPRATSNALDAAAVGATDGLKLAMNVGAMLIAFVSLVALLNWPIEEIGNIGFIADWRGEGAPPLSLELILGTVLAPLAWCMGIPKEEIVFFGSLMGEKVALTELIAYMHLGDAIRDGTISPRSAHLAAYALCGFANLPSIAIQIGGLSAIAPGKRDSFVSLGLRAMIGGALASWCTACVAGIFIT